MYIQYGECFFIFCWFYLSNVCVMQMYSLLLEVQDFEKKFMQTPEEQREALLEQHKTHTVQLYNSLREKEWDDRYEEQVQENKKDEFVRK